MAITPKHLILCLHQLLQIAITTSVIADYFAVKEVVVVVRHLSVVISFSREDGCSGFD